MERKISKKMLNSEISTFSSFSLLDLFEYMTFMSNYSMFFLTALFLFFLFLNVDLFVVEFRSLCEQRIQDLSQIDNWAYKF